MEKINVLFVEDDEIDKLALERHIEKECLPIEYSIVKSIKDAKLELVNKKFDIVVSDFMVLDGTAFDLIDEFNKKELPFIVITGGGSEEIAVKAMKSGAQDYLIKDPNRNYLKFLFVSIENVLKN